MLLIKYSNMCGCLVHWPDTVLRVFSVMHSSIQEEMKLKRS